jgi:hypothetical protein
LKRDTDNRNDNIGIATDNKAICFYNKKHFSAFFLPGFWQTTFGEGLTDSANFKP